jgi:hypothetical protein
MTPKQATAELRLTEKQREEIGKTVGQLRLLGISTHHILHFLAEEHLRLSNELYYKGESSPMVRSLLRSSEKLEKTARELWEE